MEGPGESDPWVLPLGSLVSPNAACVLWLYPYPLAQRKEALSMLLCKLQSARETVLN